MRKLLLPSLFINLIAIVIASSFIFKIGGISNLRYKLSAKHAISKMEHRNSQFKNSLISKGCTIFLGDSITEFGEWSELFPNYNILNRGIAGDGILGVQDRLNEIARHDPIRVFLMIGINDLPYHNANYVTNVYLRLLATMQKQLLNTEIVVQSILPVNNDIYQLGISNDTIDEVNIAIQAYCAKEKIQYVDLSSSFKDKQQHLKQSFTSDGIHINGFAYNTWKENLSDWFPMK